MIPVVSVNLCCYNSARFLEATLQSVFAQTFRDWELVVVDDGSTDATARIVREHIAEGWPIVYHYQENRGLGEARNQSLALSRGEFVAFIDHDDLWLPHKLEAQVTAMSANQNVGLAHSNAFLINGDGATLRRYFPANRREIGCSLETLLMGDNAVLSTAVCRRRVVQALGGFDSDLHYVEEHDLFLRIAEQHQVVYDPEPLAQYRVHSSNSSRDFDTVFSEEIALTGEWAGKLTTRDADLARTLRGRAGLLHGKYALRLQAAGRHGEARRHATAMLGILPRHPRSYTYYLMAHAPTMVATTVLSTGLRAKEMVRRWRRSAPGSAQLEDPLVTDAPN